MNPAVKTNLLRAPSIYTLCKTSATPEASDSVWVLQKKKPRIGKRTCLPKEYVIAIFPAQKYRARSQALSAILCSKIGFLRINHHLHEMHGNK